MAWITPITNWIASNVLSPLDMNRIEGNTQDLKDNKVDKVAGKGLSTEDYTTIEKSKLSGIESGAEVNNPIANNLTTTTPGSALDATQGKAINDSLLAHKADIATKERHGLRVNPATKALEYHDGTEWKIASGGLSIGNVSSLMANPENTQITLTWQDPPDLIVTDDAGTAVTIATWLGTKIVRKTGSYPANENDGVLVVDSVVRNQYETIGFTDTGLTNGQSYYYMLFPYTEKKVYTVDPSNRISAAPIEIKPDDYYILGNENIIVTGGWDAGSSSGTGTQSKEDDHLYLRVHDNPSAAAHRIYVTSQLIDVSGVNKLYVDWENIGDAHSANASGLSIASSKTGDANDYEARTQLEQNFNRKVDELDVSALTGSYYVKVYVRDFSFSTDVINAELKIYRIWGEK